MTIWSLNKNVFISISTCSVYRSCDSSVDIVTGYALDDPGSIPYSAKIFFFSTASKSNLGPTQPPFQWVPGAIFRGIKQPGHESDHSSPSGTKFKTGEAIPPLSIRVHGIVLN
jgi:hypothetical protein